MSEAYQFMVTRYGPNSSVVAQEKGLTEDEAKRLVKMATGLPLGGWGHGYLADDPRRHIIHVPPMLGTEPGTPNETVIVEPD